MRGAVILRERNKKLFGRRATQSLLAAHTAEALEENGEAAERGAAEAVNCLIVIAHDKNIAMFPREQPEQFELRDIRVLKLVYEDVAILIAHAGEKFRIRAQHFYRALQLRRRRNRGCVRASNRSLDAIDARQLLLLARQSSSAIASASDSYEDFCASCRARSPSTKRW